MRSVIEVAHGDHLRSHFPAADYQWECIDAWGRMKMKTIAAVVTVGDQEVAADYDVSACRIRITSDGTVLADIDPSDSWIGGRGKRIGHASNA